MRINTRIAITNPMPENLLGKVILLALVYCKMNVPIKIIALLETVRTSLFKLLIPQSLLFSILVTGKAHPSMPAPHVTVPFTHPIVHSITPSLSYKLIRTNRCKPATQTLPENRLGREIKKFITCIHCHKIRFDRFYHFG